MKFWKLRNNLAFNIISAIVFLLVFFSVLVSTIGYISFTNSLKREYTDMAYRTANTALTLVDGDKIDQYLETGEGDPAYDLAQSRMDILCSRMDLPLIYVIKVDTSDYNSFVSVFNSVHENSTRYTRWEAGHFRETTNEEYRQLYIDLYENGLPYGTIYRTKDLNGAEPHLTLLVPVKDSADRTTAILCVQRPMNELVAGRRPYLINIVIATVLLSALVTVSAAAYIRRQFVSPLKKVISEADRFAKETQHAERPLPENISKIYELQNLASAVNTMEHDMLRYIDNLTRIYLGAHMPPPEDYRNLPVSFRDYFELLPGEIGFLYYGRPAVNKGIFVLEEAVNRLNRAGKIPNNIKFCWILSERPEEERARLLELIKSHGLERVIKIKPSTERMKLFKIISGADYVVVPSVTEGFGFCAVEACSLERPVIHSDGGSLPEVVFGRTLSFKNRDPLDLASKLEKVIKKKEEAFDRIPGKQFDTDKMVQAMIRMYHEVMNGS